MFRRTLQQIAALFGMGMANALRSPPARTQLPQYIQDQKAGIASHKRQMKGEARRKQTLRAVASYHPNKSYSDIKHVHPTQFDKRA